jgi:hypothetical protein
MRNPDIKIYQSEDDKTEITVQLDDDAIWLTQKQMAQHFGKDSDTISLHLTNIYSFKERDKESTTKKSSVVQKEGVGNSVVAKNATVQNLYNLEHHK